MIFRKLVRLHLVNDQPSVEGILIGRLGDHYRLLKCSLLEAADRSHPLDGEVWVPKDQVLLLQKLP